MNKRAVILGGGTFNHVRCHLALAAPAFGTTARQLADLCKERFDHMDVDLILTKMADHTSDIVTNDDVDRIVHELINDNTVKIVFFNVALCDYEGIIDRQFYARPKYAPRLKTSEQLKVDMELFPARKIISKIRQHRKDIFLVGFKTTNGAMPEEQYSAGLNLLKKSSCNLVLANDISTRNNMIITPEEGVYKNGASREECLRELVDMAYWRTHLSFTRSTVVDGEPVAWNDVEVPHSLRTVINWCVEQGAYKTFNGVTTGHFAVKLGPGHFLTSIRKTNFNEIEKNGLVRVKTDGDDSVIAYGAKPSVGGQSQRIIFSMYPECDCIVHFHCPLKHDVDVVDFTGKDCECGNGTYQETSQLDDMDGVLHCTWCRQQVARYQPVVPVVSQREYECGSHQCGENTAQGLREVEEGIYAVMLDNHGPNIVFHHSVDPQRVINFIEKNFDLDKSTSGFEKAYLNIA